MGTRLLHIVLCGMHTWYQTKYNCSDGGACVVQLTDLKNKMGWKGTGKRAVKAPIAPGEPDINQAAVPMHGGIC